MWERYQLILKKHNEVPLFKRRYYLGKNESLLGQTLLLRLVTTFIFAVLYMYFIEPLLVDFPFWLTTIPLAIAILVYTFIFKHIRYLYIAYKETDLVEADIDVKN